MGRINLLDQSTIDKIAAGEVIERPASVVKELVENAMDAGATAVTVEIKEGGIRFIRITDNGAGIAKEDVPVAFLRHATSKIKSVEDLLTVSSLGFRGEALSSIAAVAQVELITKTPEELTGVRYLIEGGKEKALEEIGAPPGTTFLIRNLFFNTPARKKFLKTPTTEAGYISDMIERLALSHPEVSFKFMNNGQVKMHTSGNTNLKDIIYGVYGRDIANHLVEIDHAQGELGVKGFIGKPTISRGNRNYENYYINGRYVKSKLISKAIEDGYKTFMMQHKYPFTALHITIPGDHLDVNVHPTKMELRFREQEELYKFLLSTIQAGLSQKEMIPAVTLDKKDPQPIKNTAGKNIEQPIPEPFEFGRIEKERRHVLKEQNAGYHYNKKDNWNKPSGQEGGNPSVSKTFTGQEKPEFLKDLSQSRDGLQQNVNGVKGIGGLRQSPEAAVILMSSEAVDTAVESVYDKKLEKEPSDSTVKTSQEDSQLDVTVENDRIMNAEQIELFGEKLLSPQAKVKQKIIGQLFDTYWLVEYQDKLYIIDQHAAHEKVLYERTMESLKKKEHTSQMISPPIIVTLSMQEEELLKKYSSNFEDIGFVIEHFGGKEYSVQAVPGNLFGVASTDLLIEILDGLSDSSVGRNPSIITERIASLSCKAAVKGNHQLSLLEAEALIDELLTLENPYNCPHGRPTIVSMSKYELEKKFKRII